MKRRLAMVICVSIAGGVHAQSLFDTGRGESAILSAGGGSNPYQIQIASANSVYSLTYNTPRSSKSHWRYGAVLSAKANGSSADLFSSNSVGSTVSGQLALRYWPIFSNPEAEGKTTYDELAFTIGYSQESSTLFDRGSSTFSSKKLTGFRAAIDYWGQASQSLYYGAKIGISRDSNTDQLESNSFIGTKTVSGVATQISKTAVLAGEYEERTVYPIRLDVMYQFQAGFDSDSRQTIGLDVFAKKNTVGSAEWQPGVALLFFKPGDPLTALGGVSATWIQGKVKVGIFTSYRF